MNSKILSALKSLNVSEMTRADWIAVGMGLKHEGFPVSVWDDWSRNDSRYHRGECEKLWKGFLGHGTPVTGGTIIAMAQEHGWTQWGEDDCMDWNDEISYDGTEAFSGFSDPGAWSPTGDLITYLETIFNPEDRVGYVTGDVWQNSDGKWVPSKGQYDRTAGELIASLRKYPDDIGATVGDTKPEAGGWIRFNALDGQGVKNENVTTFRFALVECDEIPIPEQDVLYRKWQLPIAALVHSGGKSLHAIVHVDAENYEEYRQRVDFLYDFLEKHGCAIDKQNRNPSRLSRMPGLMRNGNRQYLAATNIGRKSWADWMDFVEGADDELPAMVSLSDYRNNPPKLPEELIQGILRIGHKMLISGPSKAGKSFLLMELCIAIAEGIKWLGFQCRKGRVLYINLEIDPASAINRFLKIYDAMGIPMAHADDIVIWNLRGHAVPLDQLVPKIIRRIRDQHFEAIVLDPIYKVITGDENNASDMGAFCNQFDRICAATGCSTIYCHHHSKGAQGMKRAMDRASGSGVFARDPDAQLDIIELELSEDVINNVRDGNASGWRLECSLREFENFRPVEFWFEYPVHRLDSGSFLKALPAQGTPGAGRVKNPKSKSNDDADTEFRNAFNAQCMDGESVSVEDMMEYLNLSDKTVYRRLKRLEKEFSLEKKRIYRRPPSEPLQINALEPDL